jgi:hypothetical protein
VAVAGAGQQSPLPGVVAVLGFPALGKLRCQPVLVLLEETTGPLVMQQVRAFKAAGQEVEIQPLATAGLRHLARAAVAVVG